MKVSQVNSISPSFSGRVVVKSRSNVSKWLKQTIETNPVLSRVAGDMGDKDLVVTVKTKTNILDDMSLEGIDDTLYRLFISSTKKPNSIGGRLWNFLTKTPLTNNYHCEETTRSVLHKNDYLESFCSFYFNK